MQLATLGFSSRLRSVDLPAQADVALLYAASALPKDRHGLPTYPDRIRHRYVRTTAYSCQEHEAGAYGSMNASGTHLKYGQVRSAAADWSNGIRLLGYDLPETRFDQGDGLHLTLYYQPQQPLTDNLTSVVQLVDEAGQVRAHRVQHRRKERPSRLAGKQRPVDQRSHARLEQTPAFAGDTDRGRLQLVGLALCLVAGRAQDRLRAPRPGGVDRGADGARLSPGPLLAAGPARQRPGRPGVGAHADVVAGRAFCGPHRARRRAGPFRRRESPL